MTAEFKDHFSTQSSQYQRYRPRYPADVFAWLASQAPQHALAWDCATGNGQAARTLAEYFANVVATDASENQIAQCQPHPQVEYRIVSAEQSALADDSVDLITVAQALHWFDDSLFFPEAWRVLRDHGVLAVWSYNLLSVNSEIDAIVNHYYHEIVGPYWPPERKMVEQGYPPLPAPFHEIDAPAFAMATHWNLDDMLGYLGTWSASVYYAKTRQQDPLSQIQDALTRAWQQPTQRYSVHWPLQLRVGIKRTDTK